MKAFYSDHHDFPLPEGHSFPKHKYGLLRKRVIEGAVLVPDNLLVPEPASETELRLVHDHNYLRRVFEGALTPAEERRVGLPWSRESVQRALFSVGCTIAACRQALKEGMAASLSGGTHHAHRDFGSGYCIFNDVAVAARVMQAENPNLRVVTLDCDVHQGDGTAAIFANDPSVFTFSIHGANNFPFRKRDSDLDIALADGTGDEEYLASLRSGLLHAFQQAPAQLAIYLAGADPYFDDRLGRLALTKAGLAERDRLVFSTCQEGGVAVATVMSGGYAKNILDVVDIHVQTLIIAQEFRAQRIWHASC